MKKKIVTLLLVAAMTGTMVVGCGSKADDKTADTKTEQTDDKKDTEEKKELADDEYQYVSAADTVSADRSATTCTTDKNKYNGTSGVKASTTGNVYGVYDMSGGTTKYVMGNMVNSSGQFYSLNAGFDVTPQSKYYDSYSYNASSPATYARGRLGDATVEMAPTGISGNWYSDYAFFPTGEIPTPWFTRGGESIDGIYAGIFNFNVANGEGYFGITSRTVLTVSNLSLIQ